MGIDPRTAASTQGQVNVKMGRYVLHRPMVLLPVLIGIAVTVVVVVMTKPGGPISAAAVLGALVSGRMIAKANAKFRSGDLCAACFVSTEPMLVACFTDLATGRSDRSFHVVSVLPISKSLLPEGRRNVQMGDACPACALYNGTLTSERWNSFSPEPVWLATGNAAVVEDAERRIPEQLWKDLSTALDQLPQPLRTGTYRVRVDERSGWNEALLGKKL